MQHLDVQRRPITIMGKLDFYIGLLARDEVAEETYKALLRAFQWVAKMKAETGALPEDAATSASPCRSGESV